MSAEIENIIFETSFSLWSKKDTLKYDLCYLWACFLSLLTHMVWKKHICWIWRIVCICLWNKLLQTLFLFWECCQFPVFCFSGRARWCWKISFKALWKKHYLAHFQSGFKHGYVTETAMALLVDDVCWNLDERNASVWSHIKAIVRLKYHSSSIFLYHLWGLWIRALFYNDSA